MSIKFGMYYEYFKRGNDGVSVWFDFTENVLYAF